MCKGEKWDRNQVKLTFLIELDIVKHLSNQNRRELLVINELSQDTNENKFIFLQDVV